MVQILLRPSENLAYKKISSQRKMLRMMSQIESLPTLNPFMLTLTPLTAIPIGTCGQNMKDVRPINSAYHTKNADRR